MFSNGLFRSDKQKLTKTLKNSCLNRRCLIGTNDAEGMKLKSVNPLVLSKRDGQESNHPGFDKMSNCVKRTSATTSTL